MNLVKQALYYTIVSPEALVIALVALLLSVSPHSLISLIDRVQGTSEALKYLALVPPAILVWCWKHGQVVLFPADDQKALLQRWDRFSDLKLRVFIGILFQLFFTSVSALTWLVSPTFSAPTSLVLLIGSILGSIVGAATFYLAGITAREITKRDNS